MIAILDIEEKQPKTMTGKIRSLFRPFEIEARVRKQSRISVMHIKYRRFRGKVNIQKIYPMTIGCCKTILCDEETELSDTPLKRFEDDAFSFEMMKNFVFALLSKTDVSPHDIKISYYDPMGDHPSIAEKLLRYTSCPVVFTNVPKFYEKESERLADIYGSSLLVSNTPDKLYDSDIVITSAAVDVPLRLSSGCIVFSPSAPLISMKNPVIYDYFVEVPYKYRRLRPEKTNTFYFLSALYSLCEANDLLKIIPEKCGDGSAVYSTERLISRIRTLRRSA